jgi:hypothetical protein
MRAAIATRNAVAEMEITKKISGSDLSTKQRRVFVQNAINLLGGSK